MIYTPPIEPDFMLRVGFGLVRGYTRFAALGSNSSIVAGTSLAAPQDIWPGGGAYPWMTAATALEVLSSSANDTAAGSGARSVTVVALDDSYNQLATVVVALNGVTPVQLPGGATYFRINLASVASAGTSKTNEGVITIRDSGGGTTRCILQAGYGFARQAVYTVPAGYTTQIVIPLLASIVSPSAGKDCLIAGYIQTSTGVYRMPLELAISSGPFQNPGLPGLTLTEKTDFCHRVTRASGALTLNSGFLAVQKLNSVL